MTNETKAASKFSTLSIEQLRATRGQRTKPLWDVDTPTRIRREVLHFALNHAAWSRTAGNAHAAFAFLAMAREARLTINA